jgi:hypothetical protein
MIIQCKYDELGRDITGCPIQPNKICKIIDESGNEIIIDREDLSLWAQYTWYVIQGHGQSKYLKRNTLHKNTTIEFHRELMGFPNGLEIDHINRNGLDNRKANLRIVDHKTNQNNLPKRTGASSQYFGVSRDSERKSWNVYCNYHGKTKNLGKYENEIEAAIAYDNFLILNDLEKPRNFYGEIPNVNSL